MCETARARLFSSFYAFDGAAARRGLKRLLPVATGGGGGGGEGRAAAPPPPPQKGKFPFQRRIAAPSADRRRKRADTANKDVLIYRIRGISEYGKWESVRQRDSELDNAFLFPLFQK